MRPGIELDDLSILGPIFVLKLGFTPEELGRRLVAEMWMYPDGSRVLELSTRAATNEAFQVAAEARAFLASQGIDLSGEQETKTKKALEYFAGALKKRELSRRARGSYPRGSGAPSARASVTPRPASGS